MVRKDSYNPSLRKADAIISADWHLMEKTPVCRVDDIELTQFDKLDFISKLQREHDCPVIVSGDIFNFWKNSPSLLSRTMNHTPKQLIVVYGNHDLPQNTIDLKNKSSLYTLEQSGHVKILQNGYWGDTPTKPSLHINGRSILVHHIGTYGKKVPYPGCIDDPAIRILKNSNYDLIITGHNHKPFVKSYKNKLLVNPGSLMRIEADQINHKPRVYLWYSKSNEVTPLYIPIQQNTVSRTHLEERNERNERMGAFVDKLKSNISIKASFSQNIDSHFKLNNTDTSIQKIIYKAIDNE